MTWKAIHDPIIMAGIKDIKVLARFWAATDVRPGNECWPNRLNPAHRYPIIVIYGTSVVASRFSLALSGVKLRQDMYTDHLCRNTRCVRPDHMELVTNKENVRRGKNVALYEAKSHCVNGHRMTPQNSYRRPGRTNSQECRKCRNIASIRNRHPEIGL